MTFSGINFEKLVLTESEQKDFEKYAKIKGVYLHKQVYDVLLSYNSEQVSYSELSSVIRYDKNLRDKLYIYLATFEERLRAELFSKYDIESAEHTYKRMQGLNKLKDNIRENKDMYFSNLYSCYELELGFTIELFEFLKLRDENTIKELKQIKDLRNCVMHHNVLVLGKATNKEEAEENLNTLRKQIALLSKYLPNDYHSGFQRDINNLNLNSNTGKPYLDKLCLGVNQWDI